MLRFHVVHAAMIVLCAASWPAASSWAQERLESPREAFGGSQAPADAPGGAPGGAPAQGVREKAGALMDSVELGQPGVLATKVVAMSATVEAIDPATRLVTLRADDGVIMKKTAAPDVDLTQVERGDRVSIKEIASVAVSISPKTLAAPPAPRTVVVETAAPGEKPARLTVETEEISATVASIDHPTHTAVLRNPDGSMRTVQVDPRLDLEEYSVGDQVTVRVTKALALTVETPQ